MNNAKKKKLESAGWRVGSTDEFLELTPEENAIIELRLALSKALKAQRNSRSLTQTSAADLLNTSQSRLAKMEAGDASVSLDLLIHSLIGLGVDRQKLSEIIAA